jgi:hypothetical protein
VPVPSRESRLSVPHPGTHVCNNKQLKEKMPPCKALTASPIDRACTVGTVLAMMQAALLRWFRPGPD